MFSILLPLWIHIDHTFSLAIQNGDILCLIFPIYIKGKRGEREMEMEANKLVRAANVRNKYKKFTRHSLLPLVRLSIAGAAALFIVIWN